MKQVITRALLKKRRFKSNKSLWLAAGFAGLFCLVCLLLIPNKLVGAGITVLVLLFGGGLYLKYRSLAGKTDISRACLRLLPVIGKSVIEHNDQDENGTTTTIQFRLDFGENRTVDTDRETYEKAFEGQMYYVAFRAEDNTPFDCFSVVEYVPGPEFPNVQ